jgi:hypothetical protein
MNCIPPILQIYQKIKDLIKIPKTPKIICILAQLDPSTIQRLISSKVRPPPESLKINRSDVLYYDHDSQNDTVF